MRSHLTYTRTFKKKHEEEGNAYIYLSIRFVAKWPLSRYNVYWDTVRQFLFYADSALG